MPEHTAAVSTGDADAGRAVIERRNYLVGVANGTLSRLGMGFIHPYLVLSAFVYEQTGSSFLVGLVVALSSAGLMWPQLYISSLIEHQPRKKPFYLIATGLRIVTLSIVVATMFLVGAVKGPWIMGLFLVAYFVYRSGQGCGNPVFFDLVGQSMAHNRLGGFFARRALFGGILSVLAGLLVVQPILHALPSPTSYATLAAIALVIMSCGWIVFAFVHETGSESPRERRSFRQTVVDACALLRSDGNYRVLLAIRILLRFNLLALAFYVPYGVERLGAVKLSGILVGAIAVSRMASSLVWGRISDRRGNRLCLLCSAAFFVVSPVVTLLAPRLPGLFQWTLPFTTAQLDLRLGLYLMALCFQGFGMEATMIGLNAFLIETAPPDRRPSYIAFVSTVSFPFTFLPAIAGALIAGRSARLDVLFVVVAVTGLLTLIATLGLKEVRQEGSRAGEE